MNGIFGRFYAMSIKESQELFSLIVVWISELIFLLYGIRIPRILSYPKSFVANLYLCLLIFFSLIKYFNLTSALLNTRLNLTNNHIVKHGVCSLSLGISRSPIGCSNSIKQICYRCFVITYLRKYVCSYNIFDIHQSDLIFTPFCQK